MARRRKEKAKKPSLMFVAGDASSFSTKELLSLRERIRRRIRNGEH